MIQVFFNVILPVLMVVVVAAGIHRWRRIPAQALSQTVLYLLQPAYVFISVTDPGVSLDLWLTLVAGAALTTLSVLFIALLISKAVGHDRSMQSAFMLTTAFPNSGNLAIPVLALALGPTAASLGVAIMVTQSMAMQSVGILVAARSSMVGLAPLLQVFKMPAFWSAIIAVIVRLLELPVPRIAHEPLTILANAAIPLMLVVLGFQVGSGVHVERPRSTAGALFLRLIGSAPVAFLAGTLVGLDNFGRAVLVIVFSMPLAVASTVVATEFNAQPRFVTGVVITSTLLSVVTLTIIITVAQQLLGVSA
jgi:predicted permease